MLPAREWIQSLAHVGRSGITDDAHHTGLHVNFHLGRADAGLAVEWRIIKGQDEFFNVTKMIHNGLQGDPRSLTAEQQEVFARYNALNAEEFEDVYDFVIVHDPQPIGMIDHFPGSGAKWIWRGHIDFSAPNAEVMSFLLPSLRRYDAAIFHMHEYVPRANGLPDSFIWPPAIDPLAPKNMALSAEDAAYIVDQFGIDVERPLLTQVSRFDPWKDPLGVIAAYRLAREQVPGLALVLAGAMALDDPQGWEIYREIEEASRQDPLIHVCRAGPLVHHSPRQGHRAAVTAGGRLARDAEAQRRDLRQRRRRQGAGRSQGRGEEQGGTPSHEDLLGVGVKSGG